MSFVEQDDVMAVAEDILREVWALIGYELKTPLPVCLPRGMESTALTSLTCVLV